MFRQKGIELIHRLDIEVIEKIERMKQKEIKSLNKMLLSLNKIKGLLKQMKMKDIPFNIEIIKLVWTEYLVIKKYWGDEHAFIRTAGKLMHDGLRDMKAVPESAYNDSIQLEQWIKDTDLVNKMLKLKSDLLVHTGKVEYAIEIMDENQQHILKDVEALEHAMENARRLDLK